VNNAQSVARPDGRRAFRAKFRLPLATLVTFGAHCTQAGTGRDPDCSESDAPTTKQLRTEPRSSVNK
jgi:hypothetical protein